MSRGVLTPRLTRALLSRFYCHWSKLEGSIGGRQLEELTSSIESAPKGRLQLIADVT
jgi:hypothetical protein